ncbi:MAG: RNA polymerase factor sigma-54 [Acidiferrobacterales bacterium]|nr:RNA polymerase factor sigma-54 [Acidiferrobacterales bacterium]
MRQTVELRQRQKQTFNARFSTAVRVLQLSSSELAEEIRDVVDSNPLLEEVDRTVPEEGDETWRNGELPSNGVQRTELDSDEMLELAANRMESISIREHLAQQILASGLSESDRAIADTIIDCIDERGYLTESIQDIVEFLPWTVEPQQVEGVLEVVQQLDPPGIAARNLTECLSIQLDFANSPRSVRQNAKSILRDHLELLGDRQLEQIGAQMQVDAASVRAAVDLIQSLNPSPAINFGAAALTVIPDVVTRKIDDKWAVLLNSEFIPNLKISEHYRSMIDDGIPTKDRRYLERNLVTAQHFLDNVSRRNDTVLRVAKAIVRHQSAFLDNGEHAMKPLTLQQISDAVNLHESTVSRACSGKYIMTPRGTFELKHFFPARIRRDVGEDESAMSIKHRILQIVESENQLTPLSDQQIAQRMWDSGINIARRTVAKYRAEMRVPSYKARRAIAAAQLSDPQ